MFWVYVLRSEATGRFYTGSCEKLNLRLCRHNAGENKSTRHGVPWTLVHSEQCTTRADAVRRERFLKTGRGREELKRILNEAQLR